MLVRNASADALSALLLTSTDSNLSPTLASSCSTSFRHLDLQPSARMARARAPLPPLHLALCDSGCLHAIFLASRVFGVLNARRSSLTHHMKFRVTKNAVMARLK